VIHRPNLIHCYLAFKLTVCFLIVEKKNEEWYITTHEHYMNFKFQSPQIKYYFNTTMLNHIYRCFCAIKINLSS
jgi:hypothetical protein